MTTTQTVVAVALNADGTIYDQCYTWEAGQTYAADGWKVRATAADGSMTKRRAQGLYDAERARHDDCFGPRPEYVHTTPNGTLVSVVTPSASAVSAVLRKAGHTKAEVKRSPSTKFPMPTVGYQVQNRTDHVRLSHTMSQQSLERCAKTLRDAGYVVEHDDVGRIMRVYKAL